MTAAHKQARQVHRVRSQLLTGEIVRAIEHGCIDAEEIAEEIDFTMHAVRDRLALLAEAGKLIRTEERVGIRARRFIYSLPPGHMTMDMSLPVVPPAPVLVDEPFMPARDPLVAALFGPALGAAA